jgi:hypothetical protein
VPAWAFVLATLAVLAIVAGALVIAGVFDGDDSGGGGSGGSSQSADGGPEAEVRAAAQRFIDTSASGGPEFCDTVRENFLGSTENVTQPLTLDECRSGAEVSLQRGWEGFTISRVELVGDSGENAAACGTEDDGEPAVIRLSDLGDGWKVWAAVALESEADCAP